MGQIILTEAILESLRTPNGGYDRRTLSLLGVGWPPYKKWKKKLVGTKIDSAILSVAKQSSIRPSEPYESSVIPPARFDYPTHDSHFEIQSFIYSSLKAYFDIRGQVVSGWREFDLIIFNSNFPIMIIDIDNLKRVNDTNGHAAGDALIARTGVALHLAARSNDVVARLGGDEFGILSAECSRKGGEVLLERVQTALDKADVKASVGLAFRDPETGLSGAWEMADKNMYEEKKTKPHIGRYDDLEYLGKV